jgi:hypothetical protein
MDTILHRIAALGRTALLTALVIHAQGLAAQTPQTARTPVQCQPGDQGRPAGTPAGQPNPEYREYDVIVDVPDLCVERIALTVTGLDAHLSLNSRIANLVQVQAGADVAIQTVELGIYGVRAEALLLVDLDNVTYVVDRTLTFLDNSPQIVTQLMGTVQGALGTVGSTAHQLLRPGGPVTNLVDAVGKTLDEVTRPGGVLSQVVSQTGETLVRALGAGGSIIEHTVDTAGKVTGSREVGSVLDLGSVSETRNATGQLVRQVRDTSGALIELILDTAGSVTSARVLQPGRSDQH